MSRYQIVIWGSSQRYNVFVFFTDTHVVQVCIPGRHEVLLTELGCSFPEGGMHSQAELSAGIFRENIKR